MRKILLCYGFALLFSLQASGSIVGDSFQIQWDFPNSGSVLESTTVAVSPTAFWDPDSGVTGVTIADGTITIDNSSTGWTEAAFNGFIFTDLSEIPNFTSFTLVSVTGNVPPVDPVLSFDSDDLIVNFTPLGTANTSTGYGQIYTFAFATPEPSTLSLCALGSFLALVLGLRSRTNKGPLAS